MALGNFLGGAASGLDKVAARFDARGVRQDKAEILRAKEDRENALEDFKKIGETILRLRKSGGAPAVKRFVDKLTNTVAGEGLDEIGRRGGFDARRAVGFLAFGTTPEEKADILKKQAAAEGGAAAQRRISESGGLVAAGRAPDTADLTAGIVTPEPDIVTNVAVNQDGRRILTLVDKNKPGEFTQIDIGGAQETFNMGKFKADLALIVAGKKVDDPKLQKFTVKEAQAVLDNLRSPDFLAQILGAANLGAIGEPADQPEGAPSSAGTTDNDFGQILLRSLNGEAVSKDELRKLSPDQRKILRQAMADQEASRSGAPQVPFGGGSF